MRENFAHPLALIPFDYPPLGGDIGKDFETGGLDDVGQVAEFHAETEVRVIDTEPANCLGIGNTLHRQLNRNPLCFGEDAGNQPLHDCDDILLVNERHLAVDLGEFRLAVGTQIFITETAHYLEIFVKTGNHQDLFKDLGRLRQCIKMPLVDAGRHQEVTCPFRGRFGKKRGFKLDKTVIGQVRAGQLGDFRTQDQVILQLGATKIKIAVFQTDVLIDVTMFIEHERQRFGTVEQLALLHLDFNLAGLHVRD